MNKVPVGPSTIAILVAAVGGAIAFVAAWAQQGSAPTWLGLVSAGLVALLGVLRSVQAMSGGTPTVDATALTADPPAVPTDQPTG
jgi:hypothetical protein